MSGARSLYDAARSLAQRAGARVVIIDEYDFGRADDRSGVMVYVRINDGEWIGELIDVDGDCDPYSLLAELLDQAARLHCVRDLN
jgi:hypothetical protein